MAKLISFKQAVVGKGVCREPALVTLCELCVSQALSQLQDLPWLWYRQRKGPSPDALGLSSVSSTEALFFHWCKTQSVDFKHFLSCESFYLNICRGLTTISPSQPIEVLQHLIGKSLQPIRSSPPYCVTSPGTLLTHSSQPHGPSCYSSNMPVTHPPQSLCTGHSLCLIYSSSGHPYFLQVFAHMLPSRWGLMCPPI